MDCVCDFQGWDSSLYAIQHCILSMLAYDWMSCFKLFVYVIYVVCHSSLCTIIENHADMSLSMVVLVLSCDIRWKSYCAER